MLVSAGALIALLVANAVLPDPLAECRGFRECGDDVTSLRDRLLVKFNDMRTPRVTRRQADENENGYYEGLFRESGRAVATNALVSGRWAAQWAAWESQQLRGDAIRRRDDYLHYEMRPDMDGEEFGVSFRTNSHGMADREYSLERPDGVRRVAYIGDSVLRGLGANWGRNFESLLEDTLNVLRPAGPAVGFELLNFGVEAYRITQLVKVLETADHWAPDSYVVFLTRLTVARQWSDHIGQLVADGVDLEYDALRSVVERARIRPADDPVEVEEKLRPFRAEVQGWALATMQETARARGADFMVVLLPSADPGDFPDQGFDEVRAFLSEHGIPTVDLLDVFADIDDLSPYRLSQYDGHPNDLGHRLIFERVWSEMERDPTARRILTGVGSTEERR